MATAAGTGAVVGGLSNGVKGGLIGAGIGGGIGTAIGLLTRGSDVRMDAGTTLDMVIQREVPLDGSRIPKVVFDVGAGDLDHRWTSDRSSCTICVRAERRRSPPHTVRGAYFKLNIALT